MKKEKNKKGFSLVELLAVVVILGILSVITIVSYNRYIKSAKNQSEKQLERNIIMAAKSYLQSNNQYKPKNVGSVQRIYLKSLVDDNYLKTSDFKCESESKCYHSEKDIDLSYVDVTKESNSKYTYTVGWNNEDNDSFSPDITNPIEIKGNKYNNDEYDASGLSFTAKLKAVEDGHSDDEVKGYYIASYSYIVYVDENGGNNFVEVFNSGFLSGRKQTSISLKKIDISKYIKVNKINNVRVYLVVTNNKGKSKSLFVDKKSLDKEAPICGSFEGAALDDNDWLTREDLLKGKKRKITIECIDNGGSKCKKKKYTKVWDKNTFDEADEQLHDYGEITIEDNYTPENPQDKTPVYCPVLINIDNREPDTEGPVIKLYADNGKNENAEDYHNGFSEHSKSNPFIIEGQKSAVESFTIGDSQYNTQSNANGWLNSEWYPSGIFYHVEIFDESGIEKVTWATNAGKLKSGDDGVNELVSSLRKTYVPNGNGAESFISKNEFERSWQIGDDGERRGEIVAYDKRGNRTVVYVNSKIDRTAPDVPTAKIRETNSLGKIVSNGPNTGSTKTYSNELWWGNFSGTDAMSGYNHYEFSIGCSTTKHGDISEYRVKNGWTYPLSGSSQNSCFKIRQIDNAGNSSEWSGDYNIKIKTDNFTIKPELPNWKVLYSSYDRGSCDSWSGKPPIEGNTCPSGVYGNIIGKVNASYANGKVKFDWYISQGLGDGSHNYTTGGTWINTGYYVELVILPYSSTSNFTYEDVEPCEDYDSSKVTQCIYLKESRAAIWDVGSSHSGSVEVALAKGDYDIYFAGNSTEPSYNRYMGWIDIK